MKYQTTTLLTVGVLKIFGWDIMLAKYSMPQMLKKLTFSTVKLSMSMMTRTKLVITFSKLYNEDDNDELVTAAEVVFPHIN